MTPNPSLEASLHSGRLSSNVKRYLDHADTILLYYRNYVIVAVTTSLLQCSE